MSMDKRVLERLDQQDTAAMIEWLNTNEDALETAVVYRDLVRHVYWQNKDIARTIVFARAAIQHALDATAVARDARIADELAGHAKGRAYDLASFLWPGWGEAGIALSKTDIAIGLDAAQTNLRLAQELDRGDLPLSRAHWLVGAQQLATADYPTAAASFQQAQSHARAASAEADALLSEGFAILTRILAGSAAPADLIPIKGRLSQLEHGTEFVAQIETAYQELKVES